MQPKSYDEQIRDLVDDIVFHYEAAGTIGKVLGFLQMHRRTHPNYAATVNGLRAVQAEEFHSAEVKLDRLLGNMPDYPPYEDRLIDHRP